VFSPSTWVPPSNSRSTECCLSSGDGTIGPLAAGTPSGLGLTTPHELIKNTNRKKFFFFNKDAESPFKHVLSDSTLTSRTTVRLSWNKAAIYPSGPYAQIFYYCQTVA
jgi:hypothetical protein